MRRSRVVGVWWLAWLTLASACAPSLPTTIGPVVARGDTTSTAPVVMALASLPVDAVVRIYTGDGPVEGFLRDIVGGTVQVEAPPLRSIPVARIDSVWTRSDASRIGALIGAAAGAVGGAGVSVSCSSCETTQVVPAMLIGAVVGSGLGVLVGSRMERWKRVY